MTTQPRSALKKAGTKTPQYPVKAKVMFVASNNQIHEFDSMIDYTDQQLLESLWHQPWEMHTCKQALRARAQEWRKTGLGVLLADTFHFDSNSSQSTTPSSPSAMTSSKLCQKQLVTFCQLPDELYNRGIERHLSRQHDEERTTRKRSAIREIVAQYRTLRQNASDALSPDEQASYVAQFSQQLSRDAAIFARRLGRADEIVARKGEMKNPHDALMLVDYLIHLQQERRDNQNLIQKNEQQQQQQRRPQRHPPQQPFKAAVTPTGNPQQHNMPMAPGGRMMQARQA